MCQGLDYEIEFWKPCSKTMFSVKVAWLLTMLFNISTNNKNVF